MSDVKDSNTTDRKRKREDEVVENIETQTESIKRKVGKNFDSDEKNETIDMNKLGQPEEKKETDTSKTEEEKKEDTKPKFGYVPPKTDETKKTEVEDKSKETKKAEEEKKEETKPKFGFIPPKTDETKKTEEEDKSKETKPKFGFIPPKTDETKKTEEEKTKVTPKIGFVESKPKSEETSESSKPRAEESKEESKSGSTAQSSNKPFQFSFLSKKPEGSSTEENKTPFKSTASSWPPVKMGFQFSQKSAFSSAVASESTPKLNVEEKEKVSIPDDIQQQTTGEENENILFSGICMLYIFDSENKNWKDKGGKATIHINCRKDDKSKSRILIRNFHSKRILMNSSIFQRMKIMVNENQPNSLRFTAFNEEEVEDPKEKKVEKRIELRVYMLRFKEKSEAEEAKKVLEECISNCSSQKESSKDEKQDSSNNSKNDDEKGKSNNDEQTEEKKSDQ